MATEQQITAVIKARDEASKTIKDVGNSFSGLGDVAAGVGKALVGFGVAAGAAVTAFAGASVKKYSEVGDAVEKMATRTGLSAQSVSALRVAADMGGTSIEAVETAAKKMSMQMGEAQIAFQSSTDLLDIFGMSLDELADLSQNAMDGNQKAINTMKELGITSKDVGSIMSDIYGPFTNVGLVMEDMAGMSLDEKFVTLGNAVAAIQDPAERTKAAMEVFGKAGTDLIPMFEDGTFSMDEWSTQAKKLGVSFDDLSAKSAAQLNDAIGAMGTAWNGLMLKVGGELAPVLTKFINEVLLPLAEKVLAVVPTLSEVMEGMTALKDRFVEAMAEFDAKTGIITAVKEAFDRIYKVVQDELMPSLERLFEAMKPLEPLFAAIAKVVGAVLVVAIRVLIEVLSRTIELAIQIVTWFANIASTIYETLQPALEFIAAGISKVGDAIQWVISKFTAMRDAAVSAFNAARDAIGAVPGVGAVVGALSGRALGGPVYAGTPYIVGENGPETFVPNQSGTILPRVSGGGGSNVTLNLNVNTMIGGNPSQVANEIGDLIIKKLQTNARI